VNEKAFVDFKEKEYIISSNAFILAKSVEYFQIPGDIFGFCIGISTYVRYSFTK